MTVFLHRDNEIRQRPRCRVVGAKTNNDRWIAGLLISMHPSVDIPDASPVLVPSKQGRNECKNPLRKQNLTHLKVVVSVL